MPTIKGVKLTIAKDYKELCKKAASIILKEAKKKSNLNILVPTGSTPKGIYATLKKQSKQLKDINFFNMDEYASETGLIPEKHPASYKKYMQTNLFSQANNFFPV